MPKKSRSSKSSSVNRQARYPKSPLSLTRIVARRPYQGRTLGQIKLDTARLFGQDARAYTPIKTFRPARQVTGRIANTTIDKKRPLNKARFSFDNPLTVTVCVRRRVRKEVLHALNHSGKSGQKKPRKNFNSNIRC